MFKDNYKVIGVMSGTSLDGIDLAYLFLITPTNGIFKFRIQQPFLIPKIGNKNYKWLFILIGKN